MPTFDEALPMISAIMSGMVLVPSVALLWRKTRSSAVKKRPGTADDNDPVVKTIAELRRRLNESNVLAGTTNTPRSRRAQEEELAAAELRRKNEREKAALAERIQGFSEALESWCAVAAKHIAVENEVKPLLQAFRRVKEATRQGTRDLSDSRAEFDDQAAKVMERVLRITDLDFAEDPERSKRLNSAVEKLAASAGLIVVTPRRGEKFDKEKHLSHKSGAATGRGTVSDVTARGLTRADGQILVKAEVEVDN